ncbi:MAG: M20/M25/M40 family metallo-hydrolase, partial [Anaerolineae bacterium]
AWATRQGGLALLAAAGLIAVPVLETRCLRPTITALVRRPARNLVVAFPAPAPRREVILCAHLDSKTELLDHGRRPWLLDTGPAAMALGGAGALLLAGAPLLHTSIATHLVLFVALFLGLGPAAGYALGMGANLAAGRLRRRQSSGAVDDGGSVAVLLDLARRLQRGDVDLPHTSVTLLFTVGEEVQMQGALAYVRDRVDWPLPVQVVNLEIVGQNGSYRLWVEDGTAMRTLEADVALNLALARAVEAETGRRPTFAESINSDAFAFLRRGLPAATLGGLDLELGEAHLHGPLDHPGRIDPARLSQTADVLARFLAVQ